ncbi:MAG: DUF4340 domain-containing protein [Vicinamibacterales bacterium]
MRGFRSTFVLLLVLLGLVGYIYFYELKRPAPGDAAVQKPKVFSVEAITIEEIDVKSASGERTVVRKTGDAWRITEPVAVKADDGEVTGIVSSLATLEIERVVEENAADLAQFGLAAPRIEVGFKPSGGAAASRLLLGDTNATGGEVYAKLPESARVFLVSSFLESTFNKSTFDLRDKTVLAFDRAAVDSLEIVTKDQRLAFVKTGDEWALTSPVAARAEQGQVQGAIGSLQTLAMKSIAAPEAAEQDLGKYGLDKPELTATVGAGSTRATLAIGKTDENGNVYARDVASPMVVTIDPALINALRNTPDSFRPKDVFEFRSFTATRLEITRGTTIVAFEKGTGKDGAPAWKRLDPVKDVEASEMDGLLSALSGLSVDSYVDAGVKTGAESPVAVVTATFDDGKKEERVVFGKAGGDVFAIRAGEPGAAKVDAARFDEALKALDAIR